MQITQKKFLSELTNESDYILFKFVRSWAILFLTEFSNTEPLRFKYYLSVIWVFESLKFISTFRATRVVQQSFSFCSATTQSHLVLQKNKVFCRAAKKCSTAKKRSFFLLHFFQTPKTKFSKPLRNAVNHFWCHFFQNHWPWKRC